MSHRSRFPAPHPRPAGTGARLMLAMLALACHADRVTAPPTRAVTAPLSAPASADSAAPDADVVFLAPLGRRAPAAGEPDTAALPGLTVCRLAGDACADTLARFVRDTGGPTAPSRTLPITMRHAVYDAAWATGGLAADPAVRYRVTVTLGDTVVGATDLAIVAAVDTVGGDPAAVTRLAPRALLRIRFQIFRSPRRLTVSVLAGVHGSLADGVQRRHQGELVPYAFDADSGYANPLVSIDGHPAPSMGTVRMDGDHLLVASADRRVEIDPRDFALVRQARALLVAPDPVRAAQALLDTLAGITDTAALDDRLERVALAAAPPLRDPVLVRALDAALAGHVFRVGDGVATGVELPPPTLGGGPIILFDRLAPRVARTTGVLDPLPSGEEPVTIGYVNGIVTDPLRALMTANHVLRAAVAAPWRTPAAFQVRLIYNRSGIAPRPAAATRAAVCATALAPAAGYLGANSIARLLAACMGSPVLRLWDALRACCGAVSDVAEAAVQYATLAAGSTPPLPDVRRTADSITTWRAAGRHVVLVGHSQGNMMVQSALRRLADDGAYDPPRDSTCIAAVALAAPSSADWPIAARHLRGLVVQGDPILLLGTNHFPQFATPLGDRIEAERAIALARGDTLVGALAAQIRRVALHDVIDSYLRQPPMRTAVQQAIVDGYGSCALGRVAVEPAELHLPVLATRRLTAALFDVNGDPLDGIRSIRWSASASSAWERAVELSGDRVAGRWVGGTSVQATTATRAGTGGVVVDPRPLAVTVAEQLTYDWTSLGPSTPNGAGAPGPGAPPVGGAWDGGACAARQIAGGTLYAQLCTTRYDGVVTTMPTATRYEVTSFATGDRERGMAGMWSGPTFRVGWSGPAPTIWAPGPPPPLLDRFNVRALDAAGHLLGTGHACVHGCTGWPDR